LTRIRLLLAQNQPQLARSLLQELQQAVGQEGRVAPNFGARLLRALTSTAAAPESKPAPPTSPSNQEAPLIEALGERELEALRLVAEGLSNEATESGRGGLRRAKQPDDQKNRSDQEMDNIIRRQILAPHLSVGLDDVRDYIRADEPANPQEQIDYAKDLAEGARRGV
jgi:hypothetical protein